MILKIEIIVSHSVSLYIPSMMAIDRVLQGSTEHVTFQQLLPQETFTQRIYGSYGNAMIISAVTDDLWQVKLR